MDAVVLPLTALFDKYQQNGHNNNNNESTPNVTWEHIIPHAIENLCESPFIHKIHIICTAAKYDEYANNILKRLNDKMLKKVRIFAMFNDTFSQNEQSAKDVKILMDYLSPFRRNVLILNQDTILFRIQDLILNCMSKSAQMKLFYPESAPMKLKNEQSTFYYTCVHSDNVIKSLTANSSEFKISNLLLQNCSEDTNVYIENFQGLPAVYLAAQVIKEYGKKSSPSDIDQMDSFYADFIPYLASIKLSAELHASSKENISIVDKLDDLRSFELDSCFLENTPFQPQKSMENYIQRIDRKNYQVCSNIAQFIEFNIKKLFSIHGTKSMTDYMEGNKDLKIGNSHLGSGINFLGKAVIHHSVIGDNCTIGKNVKITNSILSNGCVIGENLNLSGSIVMPNIELCGLKEIKEEILDKSFTEEILWQS